MSIVGPAAIVRAVMHRFAERTGRRYDLFDYVGHPEAERVIVIMGSGGECVHETVEHLVARGEKVGVVKVRLFRPLSVEHLLAALPATATSVAVLDRTKEPGASGDPLLQEITTALVDAVASGARATLPRLIGGRYGLASKEFTPAMVLAVFAELAAVAPRRRFTLGINDDVSHRSLPYDRALDLEPDDVTRALFFGLGADGTVSITTAANATPQTLGQIQLASFINPNGLNPQGQNLYLETASSGAPQNTPSTSTAPPTAAHCRPLAGRRRAMASGRPGMARCRSIQA